ncbi:hypothetical protein [Chryseobacterium sp.]|uniref:hypothetical protein n=1 Tax=Chryseobacterium sp. TaxID=1871047 RepID=UPI00165730A0|nr:hypothetical protein [Chryseobacterium sp.]
MSTNNNAAQTLFRFVSLRAPQQSTEEAQDKRFVLAPDQLKDIHFYQYVLANSGINRQQALLNYSRTFESDPGNLADKDELKTEYPELYDFAIWVARNKGNYKDEELLERANNARNAFDPAGKEDYILKLWNVLIYQVVTQKDFYVKETVMHLLLAIHIVQFLGNEAENRVLINARIVLPKDLMLDGAAVGSNFQMMSRNPGIGDVPFLMDDMKKQQAFSLANMQLRSLENLKKDISKMQKAYNKEFDSEYKSQEASYQETISPIIDEYNQKIEDAKTAYCDLREPAAEYDPADPCKQPQEIPFPNLPAFEFNFRDEVDMVSLSESLESENFEVLLSAIGYNIPVDFDLQNLNENQLADVQKALEGISTFQDIENVVSERREKALEQISENIISDEKIFKSVGGVIIPMAKGALVTKYFSICPKSSGRSTSFDLQINLPDATWDIAGVAYTLTETVNNVSFPTGNYYVKTKTDNIVYLSNLMASATSNGPLLLDLSYSLDIQIAFTNGQTTQFTAVFPNLKMCDRGTFEIVGNEDGNGNQEVIVDENNFIPSGFGFKQIGIAEYLKVEQTTHAYVDGEVAHIENIMAREYRQKSTRRLRRSEDTSTTSQDTEKEKLTDTTTATRFEMQSEIVKMMLESRDSNAQTYFNADWNTKVGGIHAGVTGGFASHSSREESSQQAVTQAQEVTERALDRVVMKVRQERIEKIVEEFEENNAHGFDNREGDQHVVGVFRWVDKLLKNQIYNYGKRMMFEFMVPEPAKLHAMGLEVLKSSTDIELKEPVDPRESTMFRMADFSALQNDTVLRYWAAKYNVDISEKPEEIIYLGKSFDFSSNESKQAQTKSGSIPVSEGYKTVKANASFSCAGPGNNNGWSSSVFITMGNVTKHFPYQHIVERNTGFIDVEGFSEEFPVSVGHTNMHVIDITFNVRCQLTQEAKNAWLQKTFKAIIDAYQDALEQYNSKLAEELGKAVNIKGSNPGFYRQIENTVLRKNCISYMMDRALNSTRGYGLSGLTQGSTFSDYETVLSPTLDKYTAFVKFMEQAFEWENLSYHLYPYYWGNRDNWVSLYQQEDVDPLFRSFLQSGMARVIVTVRPGFEDAVQFYMATGKIWNGGEVPVIGDELYLSLMEEMKEPKGAKQGKAWITRVPTPLTILQAQNIGLTVDHALPFTSEDPDEFEIPSEVVTSTNLSLNNNLMEAPVQLGNVNRIYTEDGNLVLAKNDEILASMTISELVHAEKQINGIRVEGDDLMLMFKDEKIASIPLLQLKEAMGI